MPALDRKTITFRHPLHSEVTDMLRHVGINCLNTADVLVGLVSLLANYQEEGQRMSPQVIICDSIRELVQRIGVGEFVVLGQAPLNGEAARAALKAAAPLALRNWAVFLERAPPNDLRYGVFAGSTDPSA